MATVGLGREGPVSQLAAPSGTVVGCGIPLCGGCDFTSVSELVRTETISSYWY